MEIARGYRRGCAARGGSSCNHPTRTLAALLRHRSLPRSLSNQVNLSFPIPYDSLAPPFTFLRRGSLFWGFVSVDTSDCCLYHIPAEPSRDGNIALPSPFLLRSHFSTWITRETSRRLDDPPSTRDTCFFANNFRARDSSRFSHRPLSGRIASIKGSF